MSKQVTHIDCPAEWQSTNDWDSHRPMLWLACEKTEGLIVEAGIGDGSTKLLHSYSAQRPVSHLDNNTEWIFKISKQNGYLNCIYVKDWLEDNLLPGEIGLLFVDLAPGETRKDFIAKWADKSKVIIVHDSEKSSQFCYGLEPTLSNFIRNRSIKDPFLNIS